MKKFISLTLSENEYNELLSKQNLGNFEYVAKTLLNKVSLEHNHKKGNDKYYGLEILNNCVNTLYHFLINNINKHTSLSSDEK